jgi:hypothetical protein
MSWQRFIALTISAGSTLTLTLAQTVKEEAHLLDKPSGAPQGAVVAAGAAAKVVERQGFWVRVDVPGRTGWIKASGLSFSSGRGGPIAIDTGRMGAGNIVSTSAARGLSAKDLLDGTPRPAEVLKMAQYAPDASALQNFMTQGQINPQVAPVQLKTMEPVPAKPSVSHTHAGSPPAVPSQRAPKKDGDDW